METPERYLRFAAYSDCIVEIRPTTFVATAILPREQLTSLQSIVSEVGDVVADIFDIMLAHWRTARDASGNAVITAENILTARGIVPKTKLEGCIRHRAGYRRNDYNLVARAVVALDHLYVRCIKKLERNQRKRSVGNIDSKYFALHDLVVRTYSGQQIAVAWRYRPGQWIDDFPLDKQYALISHDLLRLNPVKYKWEKRLGRYFAIHQRIAATSGKPLRRNLAKVLRQLGLPLDSRNPKRSLLRFQAAMNWLAVTGIIGAWRFEAGTSPTAFVGFDVRNGLKAWLGQLVVVQQPPNRVAAYSDLSLSKLRQPEETKSKGRMRLRRSRRLPVQIPSVASA